MQFRKIMGIAGAGLMACMAIATPVMATNVSDLGKLSDTVSSTNFPIFVVGATASTADVIGAVNIATSLAGYSKTSTEIQMPGSSSSAITGGVKISTPGNELMLGTSLNSVKNVLTESDLSILESGVYTVSGTGYNYKQYLYLGNAKTVFEKPMNENAPVVGLKATANSDFMTYRLAFDSPVSLNSAASSADLREVLQGTVLNIMGKEFIVSDCEWSAGSGIGSITLIGGKSSVTVKTGEEKTVNTGGKDYVISIDGVGTETGNKLTAIGSINGESFTIGAGETFTATDGTVLSVTKVLQGKTGVSDYVKLIVGADKIKLSSTGTVTKESKVVSELKSEFSANNLANGWSWMKITHVPTTDKFVKAGEKVADPFANLFNVEFRGINPDFGTDARETITLNPSGYNMLLKYNNADGDETDLYTLYTKDGINYKWGFTEVTPTNADNSFRDLVFTEGQSISANEQDFFIVEKAGFSHKLQFTAFNPGTSELIFTDENGNQIRSNNETNSGSLIIGGNTFKYQITDEAKKLITMDLNGDGTIGHEYSHLVSNKMTTDAGIYFYKGKQTGLTADGFVDLGISGIYLNATSEEVYMGGNTYNVLGATTNLDFGFIAENNTGVYSISFAGKSNPGFIIREDKIQGGTQNWIYLPVTYDAANSKIKIGSPSSSDSVYSNINTVGSQTYEGLTAYGTKVTTLDGSASISYPDTFAYASVYVMSPEGTVVQTNTTAGTVTTDKMVKVTADIAKLDTEITDADKTEHDVILLGGSCVNKLVDELNKNGKFEYSCSDWPGKNIAIAQVINDAFSEGRVAIVIAGTTAEGTDLMARKVQQNQLDNSLKMVVDY